ncbi:MAG: hypothetical protein MJ131_08120 [Lachnospiraceae bacterium]|nr:hypothetical protein [Lachnospiraceae bacterium]
MSDSIADNNISSVASGNKAKKTGIIIIAAIGIILLAAVATVFFFLKKKNPSEQPMTAISIVSYADLNKRIFQPMMDASAGEFDSNEVYRTVLTPDRSKIVVQTQTNELYYTNADGSGKTIVSEECEHLESLFGGVYEKGILYVDRSGRRHRYLFEGGADAKMSEEAGPTSVSEKNMHLAYFANNSLYLLKENAEIREKIKTVEAGNAAILSVSNDGSRIFWYELDDENGHIYMHINDENIKIDSYKRTKGYAVTVTYNEQQTYAVVKNPSEGRLHIIDSKGNIKTISVADGSFVSGVYTADTALTNDMANQFPGIYFAAAADGNTTVYYIDKDYNCEPVADEVKAYAVHDGHIYYIDNDNDLISGKLNKNKISGKKTIDNDVNQLYGQIINGHVYYMKNVNAADRAGTLHVFKNGEAAVKIDMGISSDFHDLYMSADGATIVYLKNLLLHESNTIGAIGTLCRYTIGMDSPEKIDSKVIRSSLHTGYKDRMYDGKSIVYKKSVSSDKSSITGDLYYFDGKETVKLANDVF